MTLVAVIVGIGIVGIVAKWVTWRAERGGQQDLGVVSQAWIAEHRASHISGPHG
jgi:hypothetical protein